MRRVVVLGSTGSIGTQALEVIARFPGELQVTGLAAGRRTERLARQVQQFRPEAVAVADEGAARDLRARLAYLGVPCPPTGVGLQGLVELAGGAPADVVLVALVGALGLEPTLAALGAGRDVALANKESLVAAGALVMAEARRTGARVLPVDSEHSAVFQCLQGLGAGALQRIILTASGGPLRGATAAELAAATPQQALRHPTWPMGAKVTVDSATLMNKGLEVIEAHWLFGLAVDRIDVLVHPQSIVHSLVELVDGSLLAQLSIPDMRLPIQYALLYPGRRPAPAPPLSLARVGALTFEEPDRERFPCLDLAYRAARAGGTMPAVLNAANEVAVREFLAGRLSLPGIARVVEAVLDRHEPEDRPGLGGIRRADAWAREAALEEIRIQPQAAGRS